MTDRILTCGYKTRYLQNLLSMRVSLNCKDGSLIQISCWTTVANKIYQFFESKRSFKNCLRSEESIAYILIQIPKHERTNITRFNTSERFFLMIFPLQNLT